MLLHYQIVIYLFRWKRIIIVFDNDLIINIDKYIILRLKTYHTVSK